MTSLCIKIFTVFLTSLLHFSSADSSVLDINMCTKDRTVSVHISAISGDDSRCQCQFKPSIDQPIREDYSHTPGIGSHKLHTEPKTWNEARRICNEENAHLAIINSEAEAEVLLKIFRRDAHKIQGTNLKEQAYLGLHDMFKEGEWLTIFGESIYSTGFVGWSTKADCWSQQPDNHNGHQNCATFVAKCGKMDDLDCGVPLAFFCELPISSSCPISLHLQASQSLAYNCQDYNKINGTSYKFHQEGRNWEDAKNTCASEGGYLAVINSAQEENVVLDAYKRDESHIHNAARSDVIWLGGHNMVPGGHWMTVLGDDLNKSGYVNWSKGCDGYPAEPNNDGGSEHCLGIYGRCHGWNDYNCDYRLAFVCENDNC